jgi:hypothetical protein
MRESTVEATSPAINEIATVIQAGQNFKEICGMSSDGHDVPMQQAPVAKYVDTAELAAVDERRREPSEALFFLTARMAKVRKDILCRYRILLTIDRRCGSAGGKKRRVAAKKPSAKGWQESLRTWRRTKSEHPVVAKTREVLELRRPGCAVPGQVARDFTVEPNLLKSSGEPDSPFGI